MKIGRATWAGKTRLALIDEQKQEVLFIEGKLASHPNPVLAVIEQGLTASQLEAAATERAPLAEVSFLSPLSAFVRNVIAVGKNYHEHAMEFDKSGFNATSGASAIPAFPQLFTKATTTLAGPNDAIRFDPSTHRPWTTKARSGWSSGRIAATCPRRRRWTRCSALSR